jgi:hypothetical protein
MSTNENVTHSFTHSHSYSLSASLSLFLSLSHTHTHTHTPQNIYLAFLKKEEGSPAICKNTDMPSGYYVSEVSQTQKDKCCTISLLCEIYIL